MYVYNQNAGIYLGGFESTADIADFNSNFSHFPVSIFLGNAFSRIFFLPSPCSASFSSNTNARAILRARQNFTATDQINFLAY